MKINILMKKTFVSMSESKSKKTGVTGIPTGYRELDKMTAGVQDGQLVVIAGRPGMGKTSLAANIALSAANIGFSIVYFSLDMDTNSLTKKIISAESNISHENIVNGTIFSQDWIEITNVSSKLADLKLFIIDNVFHLESLISEIHRLKQEEGVQLVVIDYLQLLRVIEKEESRASEVTEIIRSLKMATRILNIPIIITSDVSRNVESRENHRPLLHDLPESSSIEREADLVIFIYRDVMYDPNTLNPSLTELIIAKNRNGHIGTINLSFLREISKFEDLA